MKKLNIIIIAMFIFQILDGQELKIKPSTVNFDYKSPSTDYRTGYIPHPNPLQVELMEKPDFAPRNPVTFDPSYDLRNTSYLTSVKNQGACGACWTFSTFGSIESHMRKTGEGTLDFSEQNLKNRHGFEYGHCDGGEAYMSTCYFVRGDGPALESEDAYSVSGSSSSYYTPQYFIGEAHFIPTDANTVKQALLSYGALATNMYWDAGSYNAGDYTYYDNSSSTTNHGVTLVGWDDNKVVVGAPGNGAWIIKNSWGSNWGESGYFYISYHDANVNSTVAYWPEHYDYSANHFVGGYDEIGYITSSGYNDTYAYGFMRYTPTRNSEKIMKVGTWATSANATIGITIYDDFNGTTLSNPIATISNQSVTYAGFYSFNLPDTLGLTKNNDIYVRVYYETPGYNYPIPVEYAYSGYSNPDFETDRYYISFDGSSSWQNGNQSGTENDIDLCIKLYGINNQPPEFTSIMPNSTIDENELITFDYDATDDDGDDLTFSLSTYSTGMSINSSTGVFSWTPNYLQAGSHNVVVDVSDGAVTVSSSTTILTVNNINRSPSFTHILPDTSVEEESTLTYTYIADDPDTDDDLTYTLTDSSIGMTINSTSGLFSWTPSGSQIGSHTIRVTVNDGTTTVNSVQSSIEVTEMNHAPVFTSVLTNQSIDENEELTFTFTATDENVGDILSFSLVDASTGMSIGSASGTLSWTPSYSQSGTHNFKVAVTDGKVTTQTGTITLTVDNVNRFPVFTQIMPDRGITEFDSTTYQYQATDPDGQELTFDMESIPGGSITTDGLFKYVSSRVFSDTTIQILVEVTDGEDAVADTAEINITNINESPEFVDVLPDSAIDENEQLSYTFTADDIENDDLTFTLIDSSTGMSIDGSTGEFLWKPNFDQAGSHELKVQVHDGTSFTQTSVTMITVNNVNRIPAFTTVMADTQITEMSPLSFSFLGEDPDNNDLNFFLSDSSLGMEIDDESGVFTWTPNYYQSGTHNLVVMIHDGIDSVLSGDISITVVNLNQFPIFTKALPDTTIIEFDTLNYQCTGTDLDGDAVLFSLTNPVVNASITEDGLFQFIAMQVFSDTTINVGVNISDGVDTTEEIAMILITNINEPPSFTHILPDTQITENQLLQFQFQGTDVEDDDLEFTLVDSSVGMIINSLTGLFTWTPNYYQSGVHSLKANIFDGSSNIESEEITIEVTHVNQPPRFTVLLPDTQITELQPLNFTIQGDDLDGDPVTFAMIDSSDGMVFNPASRLFSWTPTSYQSGTYNVQFTISDGIAMTTSPISTITVTNKNQLPYFTVVLPDTLINENQLLTYAFQGKDDDGDAVSFSLSDSSSGMTIGSTTGVFSWRPSYFQAGVHDLKVSITDGKGSRESGTIKITVDNINRLPGFTQVMPDRVINEFDSTEFQYLATDPDQQDLTYELDSIPGGSLSEDGFFKYLSSRIFSDTTIQVVIAVSDGEATVADTAEINITNLNEPPAFTIILPDTSIFENQQFTFTFEADDIENDALTFSLADSSSGMSIDSISGEFSWKPNFDQAGNHKVQALVNDGNSSTQSIEINIAVINVNREPVFTSVMPDTQTTESHTLNFGFIAVDDDNDTLSYYLSDSSSGMTINSETGNFQWTPTYYQSGNHLLNVMVVDGKDSVYSGAIAVTVENLNQIPNFTKILSDTTIIEFDTLNFQYVGIDADGDDVSYSFVQPSENATLSKNGLLQLIAPTIFNDTTLQVIVNLSDGVASINDSALVSITNIDEPPVFITIMPDTQIVENSLLEFQFIATDVENDTLEFTLIDSSFGMSIDARTGIFSWQPSFFQAGMHVISVNVSDGGSNVQSEDITIDVINVNRSPIISEALPDTIIKELDTLTFQYIGIDPDSDAVSFSLIQPNENATLSENGLFRLISTQITSDITLDVIIQVSDGDKIVNDSAVVSIINIDEAPVFTSVMPDTQIMENSILEFQFTASDFENDVLEFTLIDSSYGMSINTETGIFSWQPTYNQAGLHKIVVNVTDVGSNVQTDEINITVANLNRAPIFTTILPDTFIISGDEFNFAYEGSDPDGENVTFGLVNSIENASIDVTGNFQWLTTEIFEDSLYKIIVSLTDDTATVFDTAEVMLMDKQYPPEFTLEMPDASINENDTLRFGYLANDADGDNLHFSLLLSSTGMSIDTSTGLFKWTPTYQQAGMHQVQVQVTDNLFNINSGIANITVNNVNLSPYFTQAMIDTSINENLLFEYNFIAKDMDGDLISYSLLLSSDGMSIDSSSGLFSWTPTYIQAGTHQVQVQITDGSIIVNSDIINITVRNVNQPPYFTQTMSDTTISYNSALQYNFTAFDPDNDPLEFSLLNTIENSSIDTSGLFQWNIGDFTVDTSISVIVAVSDGIDEVTSSSVVSIIGRVGINDITEGVPNKYQLFQNYPNPFNPSTVIKYGLPKTSNVKITIFDITGKTIEVVENAFKEAGYHQIMWNTDFVASGIYFYRIEADEFVAVKKCLYMK